MPPTSSCPGCSSQSQPCHIFFSGSHFGHLVLSALLCSVQGSGGHQATQVKSCRWWKKENRWSDMLWSKCMLIFLKTKAVLIWFPACAYLNDTGLVSPLLCSDCMWMLERLCVCVCVLCVALLLTVWNLCVRECVCVVVTGQWCACSDCILWPSALNK